MDMEARIPSDILEYELRLIHTRSATGYFSCVPAENPGFDTCLDYARTHPNDEFMRKHLIRLLAQREPGMLAATIRNTAPEDHFALALFYEVCLLNPHFKQLQQLFEGHGIGQLAQYSPLIFIKSRMLPDHDLHRTWSGLFRSNICDHQPLPPSSEVSIPLLFGRNNPEVVTEVRATLAEWFSAAALSPELTESRPIGASETCEAALKGLREASVAIGPEMRHQSALSHFSLLRPWEMTLEVRNGRHRFRITGDQTAYGRGLDLKTARAGCLMEIVERRSAFAGFEAEKPVGYRHNHTLIRATVSELRQQNIVFLDPDSLVLEAPCPDECLYWIEGVQCIKDGQRPILVPAQCVFLFCNLDEPKLFSALGSTGLASGNSMEEAKISALLEVIERDSENCIPFSSSRCFDIETTDHRVAALLHNLTELGIQVQFLDITMPLGVPCCKCFVIAPDGAIVKGTGAHLNAKRALLSALTETPYPYPKGPPSKPKLEGVLRVPLEALPNYSSGNAAQDLKLLETLLAVNGHRPVYVDLTREDIGLPVVRAIIPGMDISGDFDRFSRVSPRLFANYLGLYEKH
jgi:ribosomal protein S12 methylthiotransferase accessory factor YcaO